MINTKIQKMIILFIVILVIILIAILVFLSGFNKKNNQEDQNVYLQEEIGSSILDDYGNVEDNTISRNSYFDINTCMAQYLSNINVNSDRYYGYGENGERIIIVDENEIKKNIYNLLSEKYINQNNVSIDNVYEHVKTLDRQSLYVPLETKVIQNEEIKSFLVHGLIESMELSVINEIYAIVNINPIDKIFSIEPIYGNYNNIEEIQFGKLEDIIKNNGNNKFSTSSISYEDTVKDYINIYKRLAIGSPEILYDLLDKEYKEARFKNQSEFKEYIERNKSNIKSIRVEKYQDTEGENYTQFICVDQHENYYIFREKAILDYSLILDTYTIDLPEFVQKYNKSLENEKVLLNIQKVFEAINSGDYRYVYNKLDTSFKANYFDTEEKFEQYIKDNWFAKNRVSYGQYQKNGDIYIYDIQITDKAEIKTENITKKILMQLRNETDFVMSFDVE